MARCRLNTSWPDVRLYPGDCLEVLPELGENIVDSVITDPPYGLRFMKKEWDHGLPGMVFWETIKCIAKPGAMLLAFGGTRTWHRLVCAMEDAGWEIRDCLMWLQGQGFPKSQNISKAIDKSMGAEREKIRTRVTAQPHYCKEEQNERPWANIALERGYHEHVGPEPVTEAARLWHGWGTGLKPAWEPICLAMKPLEGTFAENALKWGVSGLWIDGGRIRISTADSKAMERCNAPGSGRFGKLRHGYIYGGGKGTMPSNTHLDTSQGRWPANLLLSHHEECVKVGEKRVRATSQHGEKTKQNRWPGSWKNTSKEIRFSGYGEGDGKETVEHWHCHPDCPVGMLDGQSGRSSSRFVGNVARKRKGFMLGEVHGPSNAPDNYGDLGGASRFFYCAKSFPKDRNWGLPKGMENKWPTVKPLKLMQYLCRLTRPPLGGVVLDPFMGTGSTGIAAIREGRGFIGIEKDREAFELAKLRIEAAIEEVNLISNLKEIRLWMLKRL